MLALGVEINWVAERAGMVADKQLEIYRMTSGEVVFDIDAEPSCLGWIGLWW